MESLGIVGAGVYFRPMHLEALGIPRYRLMSWVRDGAVERVAWGLYRLSDVEATEHESLAAVAAREPQAILCPLTALQYHGIGTQVPHRVWIAIPQGSRTPKVQGIQVKILRFSGVSARYGIQEIRVDGVPIRITDPARTIVDGFRFRRSVGEDLTLEALRDGIHTVGVDAILRTAEVRG
jgi:predicted transcriptional regulator of viral defense system